MNKLKNPLKWQPLILAIIIIILLVLSVSGCKEEKNGIETKEDSIENIKEKSDVEIALENEDKAKEQVKDQGHVNYRQMGKVENNSYSNEALTLTINVPDGWYIFTDEDIRKIHQAGIEQKEDSGTDEILLANYLLGMSAYDLNIYRGFNPSISVVIYPDNNKEVVEEIIGQTVQYFDEMNVAYEWLIKEENRLYSGYPCIVNGLVIDTGTITIQQTYCLVMLENQIILLTVVSKDEEVDLLEGMIK